MNLKGVGAGCADPMLNFRRQVMQVGVIIFILTAAVNDEVQVTGVEICKASRAALIAIWETCSSGPALCFCIIPNFSSITSSGMPIFGDIRAILYARRHVYPNIFDTDCHRLFSHCQLLPLSSTQFIVNTGTGIQYCSNAPVCHKAWLHQPLGFASEFLGSSSINLHIFWHFIMGHSAP